MSSTSARWRRISWAVRSRSVAWAWNPWLHGWWIRMRALAVARRRPLLPAASSTEAIDAARPAAVVATGRVDAHVDRRVGVLGLQVQQPGHDVLRHLAGDHAREQDHAAAQQAVDRVDRAVDGVGVVTNAH